MPPWCPRALRQPFLHRGGWGIHPYDAAAAFGEMLARGGHDDGGQTIAAVVNRIAHGVGIGGTVRAAARGHRRRDRGHQRQGKAQQSRTNLKKAVGRGITRRRVAARGGNGEGHHRVEVVTIYKTPLEFLCRLY